MKIQSKGRALLLAVVTAIVIGTINGSPAIASMGGNTVDQTIRAKTGAPAARMTTSQSVGSLTVGTGHSAGKALDTYAQRGSGTTRVMAAITDPSQSTVEFPLALPAGAQAGLAPDGSIGVYQDIVGPPASGTRNMTLIGGISPPWAVDANGKDLPTSYTYANGVLTQKVDTTGAAFPVVADPSIGFGTYFQTRILPFLIPVITVKFNRAETLRIYYARTVAGIGVGTVCVITKAWIAGLFCTVTVGAIWAYILKWVEYSATHAGKCLYFRVPAPPFGIGYFPFVGTVTSVTC